MDGLAWLVPRRGSAQLNRPTTFVHGYTGYPETCGCRGGPACYSFKPVSMGEGGELGKGKRKRQNMPFRDAMMLLVPGKTPPPSPRTWARRPPCAMPTTGSGCYMIYSIPDSNRPPPPAEGLTSPRPSWPLSAPCIPSYTRAPPSFEASANTDPTTIRRVEKASRLLNRRLSAPLLRISHLRCGRVQSREASSLYPLLLSSSPPLLLSPIVAIRLHRLLLPVTFFHPVSCLLPRHHTLPQDE